MALMSTRSWNDWLQLYAQSHQHPANRLCHTIGIPLVASSVVVAALALLLPRLWPIAGVSFVLGWIFQFVGHAYERKAPEFFKDWRFLFVGVRWWIAKLNGRI